MATPTNRRLHVELRDDLKKMGTKGLGKVVNDATRKTFTANADGAILEFAHRQPDTSFWNGVKYYGSGKSSRIRIRRTPVTEAGVTVAEIAPL